MTKRIFGSRFPRNSKPLPRIMVGKLPDDVDLAHFQWNTEQTAEATEQTELEALRRARVTLAEQQEAERSLTEKLLDEKPPADWCDLATGALTHAV